MGYAESLAPREVMLRVLLAKMETTVVEVFDVDDLPVRRRHDQ